MSRRWLDSLAPQRLSVPVPGGLTVRTMAPPTWRDVDRPVVCPWCRTTTGLTLRTGPRYAGILCSEGHAWTDTAVLAAVVPQLYVLGQHDGGLPAAAPVQVPATSSGVWLWLLPGTDAPGTAGPPATDSGPGILTARPLPDLEEGTAHPVLQQCARVAWGMLAWAVPTDGTGTLFERLVLTPGPARTVGLALWLLLYDTATTGPMPEQLWKQMDLGDTAARINPDDEARASLRNRLQTPGPDVLDSLSPADEDLLRGCDSREWADACALAHLVLVVQLHHARIDRAYDAGLQLTPPHSRPRLLDCTAVAAG